MPLSKTTQDHDEIRKWAEARGAQPAEVASTHSDGEAGILRFCFPNAPNRKDKALHEISWDEFFEKFDENNLELVYQEKTAGGEKSNFNKLVHPTAENHSSRHGSHAKASDAHAGKSGSHTKASTSGAKTSASHAKSSGSHTKASSSHAKTSEGSPSGRSTGSTSRSSSSRGSSGSSKSRSSHSSHARAA